MIFKKQIMVCMASSTDGFFSFKMYTKTTFLKFRLVSPFFICENMSILDLCVEGYMKLRCSSPDLLHVYVSDLQKNLNQSLLLVESLVKINTHTHTSLLDFGNSVHLSFKWIVL